MFSWRSKMKDIVKYCIPSTHLQLVTWWVRFGECALVSAESKSECGTSFKHPGLTFDCIYQVVFLSGHSQGISFVTRVPFKTCKTQQNRWMWALPGNHLRCPASFQSMQNSTETLNAGPPRESIMLSGMLAQRVKHNRNVECRHSQGIICVTQHRPKACETQ